jgi:hypothetical protein
VVILAHLIALLFGEDDPLVSRVRSGADIHGPAAKFIFGELGGDPVAAAGVIEMVRNEAGKLVEHNDFKDKSKPALCAYRDLGKIGIYGKNYGKTIPGFAWSTFLPDGSPLGMAKAELLSTGLDRFYPGVPKYQGHVRSLIKRLAYIMTLFGRWQPLPNAKVQKQSIFNRAWRQALNFPMQGGGQEIMALALIAIANDPELQELGFTLSLVVHDEIVGWAPEAVIERCLAKVEWHMVNAVQLLAPLRAEGKHGPNWMESK